MDTVNVWGPFVFIENQMLHWASNKEIAALHQHRPKSVGVAALAKQHANAKFNRLTYKIKPTASDFDVWSMRLGLFQKSFKLQV